MNTPMTLAELRSARSEGKRPSARRVVTHRQALNAALVVLGRDHVLVAAGFTREEARRGSRQAALHILAEVAR